MSKKYYHINDMLQDYQARPGRTLVVGSKVYPTNQDRRLLYKNSIGLDMQEGQGVDIVHDLEKPLPRDLGLFDHIDCCSVLEHVSKPWIAAKNIEEVMAPDATILLSVPFPWRVHGYPNDYWRMSIEAFPVIFPSIQWINRQYLLCDGSKKQVPGATLGGIVYNQRSEAIGFGIKCTI